MISFLAQSTADHAVNWQVASALGALGAIGMSTIAFIRTVTGKDNERQVEPTALAGLQTQITNQHHQTQDELRRMADTLGRLNREMGETRSSVESLSKGIGEVQETHREETEKMYIRINAISRESTETRTRLEELGRPANSKR